MRAPPHALVLPTHVATVAPYGDGRGRRLTLCLHAQLSVSPLPPPPHAHTAQASEEQVLSVYPTAIRRRILRYLYLNHLQVRVCHTCVDVSHLCECATLVWVRYLVCALGR